MSSAVSSLIRIFHMLITPTEILSYLAAADVFILGFFACCTHSQWMTIKKMSHGKGNLLTASDYRSPMVVFLIICALAVDITVFYNYTIIETCINQVFIIFIDLLYLHFNDEIRDNK